MDYLQQLCVEGSLVLIDQPSEMILYEVWTQYSEDGTSHGVKKYNSKDLRVKIASGWRNPQYPYGLRNGERIIRIKPVEDEYQDTEGVQYSRAELANGEWVGHDPSEDDLYSHVEFSDIEEYRGYCQVYHEMDCGHNVWYTESEYAKYVERKEQEEARKLRQQMERKCRQLSKEHNIEHVDSVEFFQKVHELAEVEREGYQDRLYGMKEDGLCIGMGVSSEQWFDEYNHIQMECNEAQISWGELFDYLEEHFPIVAAQARQVETV